MTYQTVLTERGQVSVPAGIRRRYRIKPGMGLMWVEREDGIYVLPVPEDPIAAFQEDGPSTYDLHASRKQDRLLQTRKKS